MEGREALKERLKILRESGLIDNHTEEQTIKIVGILYEGEREPDMEKMEIFTTHIAMAIWRIQKGELEQPLAEEVLEDLKKEAVFEEAGKLGQRICEAVDVDFPQVEREYLMVHLCNLLM